MKIAVTGASGRIGNVLARRLLEAGHELRVLARRESRALAGLPVQLVRGDLFDEEALAELTIECEALYHLAAVISIQGGKGGEVRKVNVEGTRKILEISSQQGVRRVVYFSSVHAFSEFPLDVPFDETRPLAFNSRMVYDQTKAEAMDMALRFAAEKNMEVLALCPTGVLGPFDFEPSLSGKMLLDFYRQKIPMLVPGGFDWVDVRDVTDAAANALHKGRSGEAYLLSGNYVPMTGLAELINKITGKPAPKLVAPDWLLRLGLPFVYGYSKLTGKPPLYTGEALDTLRYGSKLISCEKARRELGYSARPLEDTIAEAYDWFWQNGYL
ncbi:MAG: NAD-dependent epimerase/dehydratase family protein [Haliscomenobacteraceae bacterium CHB4]|nr:2-alkyl-3-oxoalkanoate reductase [Saprospiraceae bacterium]MCE7923985.1 NAD-dependent epimerase/dehydratase family protein [Haliscomenobacteraceae bacterium CHB4]